MNESETEDTFYEGGPTTATIKNDDGSNLITIVFPNPTMAVNWLTGIKCD